MDLLACVAGTLCLWAKVWSRLRMPGPRYWKYGFVLVQRIVAIFIRFSRLDRAYSPAGVADQRLGTSFITGPNALENFIQQIGGP